MSNAANTYQLSSGAENRFIAEKLGEVADLLERQGASAFRVRAYQDAAVFAGSCPERLRDVLERKGRQGLVDLPTIGVSIAAAIEELLQTGDLAMIERLRGDLDPERLFLTVPGIGPKLAADIHDGLHVETLEALEAAAHNGQLAALDGIGPRRLRGIQYSLAEMLARRRPSDHRPGAQPVPVEVVLEVDAEYRRRDREGTLPTIAPRRFNPTGAAWLPILHTERAPWRLTALYSNTPNAHRRNRTRDWVVIFFERDGSAEGQCTVVTETRGPQKGQRVVRGHERQSSAKEPVVKENNL